jgi:hypothetical protein
VDDATRYALYALVVALLAPGVVGLLKAASFRGDIFDKWNDRVDVTLAGLSERAVTELLVLQRDINTVLGGTAEGEFDPLKVVVDPSMLSGHVDKYQHCIGVRNKLRKQFAHLLKLGPISISCFVISVVMAG